MSVCVSSLASKAHDWRALTWIRQIEILQCSAVLFFWVRLVGYFTNLSFLICFQRQMNLERSPKTWNLPLSFFCSELLTHNAAWVFASIQSTCGSRNFSWRTVSTKCSAKCKEKLRFSTVYWAFWSQTGLICASFVLFLHESCSR